ncbi:hypothetical protein [Bifidobacterium callitrichidarum]|uniref:hypothetical protein n=1 Tax=Bifidobacterium callitrichidarum TaxID=2052941 RepID=UPI0011B246F8|nr:hypothetical protein [Bifidobacterium callitrichidarum]
MKLYDFSDPNLQSKKFTVPAGMRFDHWNIDPKGAGTSYYPNATFTYGAKDVNLYPVFVPLVSQMPSTGVNGAMLWGASLLLMSSGIIIHRRNRTIN